ncbi:hypothetical protein ACZ87_01824 [Candidatus Erwinia dacicola]|uniref:Uncharacterized protein n=1 Tax=Candidatus Erwinia dacicola TaxID=252393 RepID=A0A328TMG8_9GAMM|nr:hypothetical protein ACZ87_01824 [Candidatus Erwinia dacicola]
MRLAYLESQYLRAVACMGPVMHSLLSDTNLQDRVPEMYMDILASRLGMSSTSDSALSRAASR